MPPDRRCLARGSGRCATPGAGKRRIWRKVPLAIDADAKDVMGVKVTTVAWTDGELFGALVDQVEGTIEQIEIAADDARKASALAAQRQATLVVPPRDHAVAWDAEHPQTQALAEIQEKGVVQWKKDAGYHRRSLAENAMDRLKQLFGAGVASHQFDAHVNEIHARIAAMHRMTDLECRCRSG